jgi:hypothetical protein
MLHHVSIGARNPSHVADVLAELMRGRAYPFPGGFRNSFMTLAGDDHGTAIEVYPDDLALSPDGLVNTDAPAGFGGVHVLLSVPVDLATIERIGQREGWVTRLCGRGAPGQKPVFHVVEFWVENRILFELAPMDMIGEYEAVITIAGMDRLLKQLHDNAESAGLGRAV